MQKIVGLSEWQKSAVLTLCFCFLVSAICCNKPPTNRCLLAADGAVIALIVPGQFVRIYALSNAIGCSPANGNTPSKVMLLARNKDAITVSPNKLRSIPD